MGTKTDKELEKGMKQVLSGLYDLRQDQMEKQYKKHWSEIKVPFSLHDGLSKFTKYELDAIRKNLYIKNASSLKKAELIALLQERIPEYLEQIYLQWDDERFKLLTKIADNGGYIVAPDIKADQIDYFRASGLIYTGTFNGKKILAVPDELIGSITALKNNVKIRAMVKRNTEWIKLTRGLLYYYGTLSTIKLVDMLEKYTEETLNFGEYVEVIENANTYRKGIYIDEDGFSNSRVFDPKRVKREHKARKNISFYPFSKHQLLTAGEPEFVDRNESYVQLVRFFTQNFEIDKVEADRFVEECVYATKIGESPNDILQYLGHTFEFDSLDTVQALMDKVVYLMNNTREWFLKGYTSTELSAMEKKHIHPLPTSASNQNESANTMKIGRNEPCPCGSGKKYKKCCGR